MNVFDRYAPFIQDFIYQHRWENLRAIQVAAGEAIFSTDDNVLLCASTASGKTEAAFFPILTLFSEDPPSSIGALYIGPLKALINDQFSRLNELCQEAEIPVWHWHGDVSPSHKAKMLKNPSGILQITPESLEALMLHKHMDIPRLFHDLRFVVIDEVHSLMRGDRGGQTLCLLERLDRLAGCHPRRIGLSATIGDLEETGRFLSSGTGRNIVIPRIDSKGQVWRLSMEHFYNQGPQASELEKQQKAHPDTDAVDTREVRAVQPVDEVYDSRGQRTDPGPFSDSLSSLTAYSPATDTAPVSADPGLAYIFEHTRGRKCLVFCNSREEAEAVTTTLRQYCEARHEPDRFLIHHGNLSASLRQSAEADMKDEETQLTTVTTATLELGIDIGRLERAFQIDACYTVSSFLQRMGRTGRRSQPPEMWFVMREDPPMPRAMLPENIPWKLLQGIAIVQVYLEERWVEPPRLDRLPYNLLYHQTMSTLASGGEMTPACLASRVLSLSCFYRISQDDYRVLLQHLIDIGHIQKTEQGGLIVGLAGERVVNSYRFYAVFQENEEYTVRADSEELGTIVQPPPVGDKIAIAGHVWVVEEVDHKRHMVYCTMVKGNVPAFFGLCPGDIHTHILERMKAVLSEDKSYPYLMQNGQARLAKARTMVRHSDLLKRPLISLGGRMWALFPWLGTYSFMALERFLKIKCAPMLGLKGFDSAKPYYMQFTMDASEEEFYEVVTRMADQGVDPMELLYPTEVPVFEKYDEYVPASLIRKGFALGVLNTKDMLSRVAQWKTFLPGRLEDASADPAQLKKGSDALPLEPSSPAG